MMIKMSNEIALVNNNLIDESYDVYIIETISGHLYCGIAKNFQKRYLQHQEKKGAKFLKAFSPKQIVFLYRCHDRSEALKIEYKIKQLPVKKKRILCQFHL